MVEALRLNDSKRGRRHSAVDCLQTHEGRGFPRPSALLLEIEDYRGPTRFHCGSFAVVESAAVLMKYALPIAVWFICQRAI